MTENSTARFFLRVSRAFVMANVALTSMALATTNAFGRGDPTTTLTVTTTKDSGAGSLRQALADGNDGDMIQFDPALNGQTISLTSGELVIAKNITISGPGPNVLAVSREQTAGFFRIFHVMSGHTVVIEGLTISRGEPPGGGLYNEHATLTINNCIIQLNGQGGSASGGGIYNDGGSLTVTNSMISNNTSDVGGGISNRDGMLAISDSTVSQNIGGSSSLAFGRGGGIDNSSGTAAIANCTISSNRVGFFSAPSFGGGIYNGGMMTVTTSTVVGNSAYSQLDGGLAYGGGIYNSGMLTLTDSTVSVNEANGKSSGVGGGIYNDGDVDGAALEIGNITLTTNYARLYAGGILNNGTLEITNSTLSDNRADNCGGICNGGNGATQLGNTILNAGPFGANISNNGGTITSHGYNLSSDGGGGFLTATGDQINTDPILGPLQDNGGQTFTHNLLTGSPAINAGDPKFTPPPTTDQRGYLRVYNGRIDIGSLEVQPGPSPTPSPTTTASPTATASPTTSPAQALNISTRLRVDTGDNVLIGGFIVTGTAPKHVAVRGIGPSLGAAGVPGVLADPRLELHCPGCQIVVHNEDWQGDPNTAADLIALGLALPDPRESGFVIGLIPGPFTAILAGQNGTTGVGLLEIYDVEQTANSQLGNISTRGLVQTDDNVMIGGFILGAGADTFVAVRGIGPSLSPGLTGVLADPTLELRDSNGALLGANDNWQDDPISAGQLSAHGLALQNSVEAGIWASLSPGAFTAILAGTNSGTGVGLVEIYNVQ